MPAKVIWAPSSLADLESAVSYIATANPQAAIRFGEACVEHSRQLIAFPRLGRPFLTSPQGEVRELIVAPYRLLYRVASDGSVVTILRVWHAARGEPSIS